MSLHRSIKVVVDQFLSSFSNGILVFTVAGISSPTELGQIGLAVISILAVVTIQNTTFLLPLHTNVELREHGDAAAVHAFKHCLILALPATVVIYFVTTLASGSLNTGALILIAATPLILLTEALRQIALSQRRIGIAIWSDALWSLAGVLLIGMRIASFSSLSAYVGVWICGAGISFIVLSSTQTRRLYAGLKNDLSKNSQAARAGILSAKRFAAPAIVLPSSLVIFQVSISKASGIDVFGVITASAQVWAPIAVLAAAVPAVVSNLKPLAKRIDMKFSVSLILLGPLVGFVWAVTLLLLWPVIGELILGSTSNAVHALIPAAALSYGFFLAQTLLFVLLLRGSGESAAIRIVIGISFLRLLISGGILMAGEHGPSAYVLIDASICALQSLLLYVFLNHKHHRSSEMTF